MNVVVSTTEVVLEHHPSGVLCVSGSRVPLDTVVFAFNEGATAEEIVWRYPTLDLRQVYAVINYYLQHRTEVEAYLAERAAQHDKIKAEAEARFNPQGIRERLLARRNATNDSK